MKLTKKQVAAVEKIKSILTPKMRYYIAVNDYRAETKEIGEIIDSLAAGPAKYFRHHLADLCGLGELRDQIRSVRAARSKQRPAEKAKSAEKMYQARQSRLTEDRLATWCQRRNVSYGCDRTEVTYRHEVVWATSGWCFRHRTPAAQYDELIVWVAAGEKTAIFDKKENTLKIGPWEWRKGRGHTLSVRFVGTDQQAAAEWAKTQNQAMRRAIIAAHGEKIIEQNCKLDLVQADDFGRLYWVQAVDIRPGSGERNLPRGDKMKYVRVVCPTTGAIYWLACRPNCQTAKEAVAASFGLSVENYSPAVQA